MDKHKRGSGLVVTGKPAVAILAMIGIFILWRLLATYDTVAPEIEEKLRFTLSAEYARSLLPRIQEEVASKDEEGLRKSTEELHAYTKKISFASLRRRGGGDNVYVRAEILVDGKSPPVGKSVRYFQFSHSYLLGYVYTQEAFALEYYLPFFGD
jgi:hypothetical protein